MKKIFLLCSFIIAFSQANAQDTANTTFNFRGYSGGMTLHTGYLYGGITNIDAQEINIQGVPFGIGGAIRLHFGEHFRVGVEGYSSTLNYEGKGKNKSYLSLGWGGLLIDCPWQINKFSIFLGGTVGGGGVKNVTVTNTPINSMEKNAIYQKCSIVVIDPFIGVEYALTPKMSLIAKIDWIFNLSQKQTDLVMGPRVYLGFSFFHSKKH